MPRPSGFSKSPIPKPSVPGFDHVRVTHNRLRNVVGDSRYKSWQNALKLVQAVYLIADTTTGKQYVGKADGGQRLFGRWSQYAHDGHGGNKRLRELISLDPDHARRFQFSILRVFGPSVPQSVVDEAEEYYKRALLVENLGSTASAALCVRIGMPRLVQMLRIECASARPWRSPEATMSGNPGNSGIYLQQSLPAIQDFSDWLLAP